MASDVARILNPRSVAMIGASEDQAKFGGRAFWMLLRHRFAGEIYPVNPRRAELFGLKAYPSVGATPTPADVAILAIPKPFLQGAIEECAAAGVRGAIIITSQFAETGAGGRRSTAGRPPRSSAGSVGWPTSSGRGWPSWASTR